MRIGLIGLILSLSFSASSARADMVRDFVVSCSYGVLAGTMVGAATLAFSEKPGDNLNKVARGASLGLYAGILLGAYVVFGGPSEDEDAAAQLRGTVMKEPPRFQVYPLLSERGVEGAATNLRVLSF